VRTLGAITVGIARLATTGPVAGATDVDPAGECSVGRDPDGDSDSDDTAGDD